MREIHIVYYDTTIIEVDDDLTVDEILDEVQLHLDRNGMGTMEYVTDLNTDEVIFEGWQIQPFIV